MPVLQVALGLVRRLHTRHKFALLGALGMLMVATPWVGLLREQAREIESALGAQAALDPVARAVDVQRALLAHREPAARVLRGRLDAEAERLQRQRDVDAGIDGLSATLQRGQFVPALQENTALRDDWADLCARILARSVTAAGSDAAHRLLVEQTLQIVDLVAFGAPIPTWAEGTAGRPLALQILPRLEVALSDLDAARQDGDAAASRLAAARVRRDAAQAQRWLAAAGAAADHAGARRDDRPDGATPARPNDGAAPALANAPAASAPLQQARRAGSAALAGYLATLAESAASAPGAESPASPARDRLAAAAVDVVRGWADAERAALGTALAADLVRRTADRRNAQIALAACLALWIALLALLWPRRPALAESVPFAADGQHAAGSESRGPTRRLLRRLQQQDADTGTPTHY